MVITVDPKALWYHGSNQRFEILRPGSTITQWQALAEAFSHQPTCLGYDTYGDDTSIVHNGTEPGYLYIIDEPIVVGPDIYPHPHTSMDHNAEFLTRRELRVRLVAELPVESQA